MEEVTTRETTNQEQTSSFTLVANLESPLLSVHLCLVIIMVLCSSHTGQAAIQTASSTSSLIGHHYGSASGSSSSQDIASFPLPKNALHVNSLSNHHPNSTPSRRGIGSPRRRTTNANASSSTEGIAVWKINKVRFLMFLVCTFLEQTTRPSAPNTTTYTCRLQISFDLVRS